MKFLHTGDLHIGKRIFETSLLEDQKHMLSQIVNLAKTEKVQAVVIAGDVYDRSVPATEAVTLLDDFLTELILKKIAVIMISGNHDSPERVSFADKVLEKQGLFIAGTYEDSLRKVELKDEAGDVCFVCLPFVKSGVAGGSNSQDAVAKLLEKENLDFADGKRYVLITHYFVTGENGDVPELSESESDIQVGGLDNVSAALFKGFSYVALGHIHKAQHVGEGPVYYAGAPMKYSFSEANSTKSVNIVELMGNGETKVTKVPIKPLHEMRCIKGNMADLMNEEVVMSADVAFDDYIQATLTDKEELINPIGTLRSVYPNVLNIQIEKNYQVGENYESMLTGEKKDTAILFGEFFEMLTGNPLSEKQQSAVKEAADEAK